MTPLDTPDAVISAGLYTYGPAYGMNGPARWRRVLNKLLRRKPITQRWLLHIVYRNNTERCERVNFDPAKCSIGEFVTKLLDAPSVRSVQCAELLFRGRKSFGADYDPANWLDALKALTPAGSQHLSTVGEGSVAKGEALPTEHSIGDPDA